MGGGGFFWGGEGDKIGGGKGRKVERNENVGGEVGGGIW